MNSIGIIGAGSFGSALAVTLSKKGHDVKLYGRSKEMLESISKHNENIKYLPEIKFNKKIQLTNDIKESVTDVDFLIFAVPTQSFRNTLKEVYKYIDESTVVVNVAKGIEQKTHLRLSEVAYEIYPQIKYVALSGPSHAEEIGKNMPTTVVVASKDLKLAQMVQEAFITDRFRVYTNEDIVGIELCGALKNVIALGAGISDGLGLGDNAKAALMTRGLSEMARLSEELGADILTFLGLSGIGDLIVTCTSLHSRNRRCGYMIGQGESTKEAVNKIGMVVEGITTTEAAYELAMSHNVEMPIVTSIYKIIKEEISAKEALNLLMSRDKKDEITSYDKTNITLEKRND